MIKLLELTPTQQKAYNRFIYWRDFCRVVTTSKNAKNAYVIQNDVASVVDVAGYNHPFYEANEPWLEYQRAFQEWLAVEPEFRKTERLSMVRGDYGRQDSWKDRKSNVQDVVEYLKGESN